ncbi:MAG: glycoside hydrolase family 9 protein, partial [Gaiellaceae bacterium]
MPHRAFRSLSLVAPLALGAVLLGLAGAGSTAAAPSPGEAIRVDQLGYTPAETKIGYVISTSALGGARFSVLDASGKAVLHGAVGASRGRWNARYRAVQPLDFSALRVAGSYRIRLDAAGVLSPPFRVASAKALFLPRVADTVSFFQAQRDGSDVVPGPLQRKPSHLRDRHALVYAVPRYESSDSDVILGASLERIGGPVDVEGGWMDAGDFIKFTHTTAYADVLLLEALRRLGPAAPRTLAPETRHGLDWLAKAWDPKTGVMIAQVGIGSGNKSGTFAGDHDLWRLPQRDDHLKGAANRYVRDRPVFRANAPGTPLPPNIAGRVAAA